MDEILKKIDEEITYHKKKSENATDRLEKCRHRSRMHEAKKIKGIILSQQKEPITLADKIRSMANEEMAQLFTEMLHDPESGEPTYEQIMYYIEQPVSEDKIN